MSTISATTARAEGFGEEAAALARQLSAAVDRVAATTTGLWSTGDPDIALSNASVYLEAVGHVVVAWMWLEQFLAASDHDGSFYAGKRHAARYFFRFELPRTGPQFDLLDSLDQTSVEMDEGWF